MEKKMKGKKKRKKKIVNSRMKQTRRIKRSSKHLRAGHTGEPTETDSWRGLPYVNHKTRLNPLRLVFFGSVFLGSSLLGLGLASLTLILVLHVLVINTESFVNLAAQSFIIVKPKQKYISNVEIAHKKIG